jgi:hypothetical protein
MQKRPADDEGLHIDVKFTGLAGSDTEISGDVFEYQSVFSAVANFTECNELGEPIGEVLMETIYFSDETNFIGKPVTSVEGNLVLPVTPAKRAGHEDIVLKHSVLAANPNKLYKCWLDFYTDGGSTNTHANSDAVVSSNEFIVMGKALASPTLVRDLKAPDDKNIYLTANWGNLPLSQKIITIRDVSDKTTMRGTSVSLVSLDENGNFVNAGTGEQKIILCASLPTGTVVKELNSVVKVDSNQNYWVLFKTLLSDKTYSINAKVITRGLVQSATSPSVTVGYNPGAFESPTIVAVRPGLAVNNVKMYFKPPTDVLTLKNLITPEIPTGLTLQSYKVTKETSVTFSLPGKMRKNGLESSANPLDLLDNSLIIDSTAKPFAAGTTLRVDGSVYNRGASDKLANETDITDCYVVDKTFPNLSYEGVPLTSVAFGLTAVYSGYTGQPETCSATGLLQSVSLAVAPVINKVEILQDFETRTDSMGKTYYDYANGNITMKVAGQRFTTNFTGVSSTRVKLYWKLTEELNKIRNGVARYTDAMGQIVEAVPARALTINDFTYIHPTTFTISLPTGANELNVFGDARNYVINMLQEKFPGNNGENITFYASLQSSDADVSTFNETKVYVYTKQASPDSPAGFAFELTNSNQLKATLREVTNFGLGSDTVKKVTDLLKSTEDYKVTANTNLQIIANTYSPTVAATQDGLSKFNASVDSIYKVLSVKDKYTKAIIAINAVSEAAKIVGTATELNMAKWVEVNTKLTTAVNATLPIPPAVTATTITPADSATAASLSVLATNITSATIAALNASSNIASYGATALTALAAAASEALKAIKTLQIKLQFSIENYDTSDLVKRLAVASAFEKIAKITIGYSSWTTSEPPAAEKYDVKFIELNANSDDYNSLIDPDTGFFLTPEKGTAQWKAGTTVRAWIESINVKSVFNDKYTFETAKAGAVDVTVLTVPSKVINETAIPIVPTDGTIDTTGNFKYKFTEPENGEKSLKFKIVYKRNGSSTPMAIFYFTTVTGNNQGKGKTFDVIVYKTGAVPSGGLAVMYAGSIESYTSVNIDQFNTGYMAHSIGEYDFGDLITVDIYNIGSGANLTTVYKTLNLVPAKPATIDSIVFTTPTSGDYVNDDVVTYTISNNGSAIESLYSLDVFGNLLLPTSVEPVTQFTFETNKTMYSGSVVNALSFVNSDKTAVTAYSEITSLDKFNAQFKNVNTNALVFKPPSRVVKSGGDPSATPPDYLISSVISCVAIGTAPEGGAPRTRIGAAVPDKTIITLKYDTSDAKRLGGSTAGLQAVFAILYSKQTTQQNVPSYKLQTVTQNSAQALPVVK